jgi:hypothetical protein
MVKWFAWKPNWKTGCPKSVAKSFREETGDNEARPDEMGSGFAMPTVDPTSLGGNTSIRHPSSDRADLENEVREDDSMEVLEPTNRALGLTDVDDVPPEDWAADTGGTKTPGGGK